MKKSSSASRKKSRAVKAPPGARAGRPQMPGGYQIAGPRSGSGLLPWSWVDDRLRKAWTYWVATTRSDGRPHVMPVWAVWSGEAVYFGTDRSSQKARNLASRPAISVQVEKNDEAIVLEGIAREAPASSLSEIDALYLAKYRTRLLDAPGDLVVYEVRPRRVIALRERDFNRSATRWLLPA